jgi:uncharacterized phage protein gp47/JayE
MSFPVPSLDQIRNRYLTTLQNMNPDFDISVDSDHYVRATAIASVVEGLYQFILWVFRQIFPDTADAENVEHHAAIKDLQPKDATYAAGTAKITGTVGAVLPAGSQIVLTSGALIELSGGSVTLTTSPQIINVKALTLGSAGNAGNAAGTLTVARNGIDSEVSEVNLTDGVDAESIESLLGRLLELLRNPPAGGKVADLKRWAEAMPGVTNAFVFARLRGLGTTDVFISTPTGLPSAALLTQVLNELTTKSPSGIKDIAVRAPTFKTVAVTVQIVGTDDFETVLKPQVTALITSYFATLEPGENLVIAKLQALVSSQPNITDCKFTAPLVNQLAAVNGTVLEWVRLGTLTVTPLV